MLFTRILWAIDFSPSSLKALAYAASLADQADARLTAVHVPGARPSLEPVVVGVPGESEHSELAAAAGLKRLHATVRHSVPRTGPLRLSGREGLSGDSPCRAEQESRLDRDWCSPRRGRTPGIWIHANHVVQPGHVPGPIVEGVDLLGLIDGERNGRWRPRSATC